MMNNEALKLILRVLCKHCSLDPVPTWLVKRAAEVLAPIVTNICNESIQSGILPTSQKQAIVTAQLKKPSLNPGDLNSCWPISNLSFLWKLVERIVATQFITHADNNYLLPERQSAYRCLHTTESALLIVFNDIIRAVDDGNVVAMALLDLSSTFDTVDHATLLSVLRSRFSITDQALSWFQSYLTHRTQIFTSTSNHSLPIPLVAGMTQGSGLSPTQFIAYTENTTDIFQKHGIQYHLFVDDTQVYSFSQVRDAPILLSCLKVSELVNLLLHMLRIGFSWMLQKVNLYGLVLGRYHLKYLNSFIK